MRISFASQTVPSTAPSQSFGGPVRRPLRSSGGPRQSSGGRGPRGGSRRRQQNNRPKPTEADLDADMDSYMAAPVQSILKCCFFILNVNFIRRLLFRRRIQRCSRAYFIFFRIILSTRLFCLLSYFTIAFSFWKCGGHFKLTIDLSFCGS